MAESGPGIQHAARRLHYRAIRLRRSVAKLPLTLPGRARPLRFMVLCRPRTGSNHLLSLLERHPNTLVYGEKLRSSEHAERFLDRFQAPRAAWVRATGFKLFYRHPDDSDSDALWDRLQEDTDLHVIHLRRANLLHALLSEYIATVTDCWVVRSDQSGAADAPQQVRLPAAWLEEQFAAIRRAERENARRFAAHPSLEIGFESLIGQRQREFDRLCDFLDLPRRPARSYTTRQRRRPAHEIIANYAELRAHFRDTEWAEFFTGKEQP